MGYSAGIRGCSDAVATGLPGISSTASSLADTFRVPANRFEDVLHAVKGMGKALDVRVNSEDVTEEYVDADAQLRNLA